MLTSAVNAIDVIHHIEGNTKQGSTKKQESYNTKA